MQGGLGLRQSGAPDNQRLKQDHRKPIEDLQAMLEVWNIHRTCLVKTTKWSTDYSTKEGCSTRRTKLQCTKLVQ
jgi:hypothetical protein